jgi:translation initiation factor IF-3
VCYSRCLQTIILPTLSYPSIRINHQIKARELRVITDAGDNLGVISLEAALTKAHELGMDLIEISPSATPPVAKIMDFGKYQYLEDKKAKAAKSRATTVELKTLQVKIGTGDHDLSLKAKKASEWLKEGHRIKLDLYLQGRAKGFDEKFLKERLERLLILISEEFKIADPAKRGPKGLTMIIERAKK